MTNKIIYIEKIRIFHYPFIKSWIRKGFKIYVFDFNFTASSIKWLKTLIDKRLVSLLANYSCESHVLALDNVEKVFTDNFRNSRLKNTMADLYKDVNVELAYKKELTKQLSEFYAVQILMNENQKTVSADTKSILIPEKYHQIQKMLLKNGIHKSNNFRIPLWAHCASWLFGMADKATQLTGYFTTNLFAVGMVVIKSLAPGRRQEKLNYKYAVAITNPTFQFKFNKSRNFDFLLDGEKMTKGNTLFVLISSINSDVRTRLLLDGYNIADCALISGFKSALFDLKFRQGLRMLKELISFGMRNIFSVFFERPYFISCTNIMLVEYLRWSIVLSNLKLGNLVVFNSENTQHIGRNILLNQHSCKTWYYAHSACMEHIRARTEDEIKHYKHWIWSYLFYDFYVGWSKRAIEHQKMHSQQIGEYLNVGCLWSTLILNSSVKTIAQYLHKQNAQKTIERDYKVLSVFDTSFVDGISSNYPLEDGVKFYSDILKLLEDMPDLFVVAKEKKTEALYSSRKTYLYSSYHEEYSEVLRKLRAHPRAYLPGPEGDTSDVISISDLVITYAHSSCTIEALGARKKAVFYDPKGKLHGYFYSDIPGLVAHSYDELNQLAKRLIYKVSADEYGHYLNSRILGAADDYLDGKGLSRFRDLLTKN